MSRIAKIAAALAAASTLGAGAAAADVVTYRTYTTTTTPQVIYTTPYTPPVPGYGVPPATVVVPAPAGTVVTRQYVVPQQTYVVTRPADCGLYRYWDGTACADARYQPPALIVHSD